MSVSSLHLPDIPTTIFVRQSPPTLQSDPASQSVLEQTELMYDELLADRQHKLQLKVDERRREFEEKLRELSQVDAQKAVEFKRWSDAALEQFEFQCAQELCQLRQDYERNYAKLQRSLVEQQQQQQQHQSTVSATRAN